MRTTITLDDDTAAKLKAEMRHTGKSMKETLNEALRRGFAQKRVLAKAQPFRVNARDLGELRPGLNLDNIGELLEQIEGAQHR
jgi:Ribbon-helix-helix protein, copG family